MNNQGTPKYMREMIQRSLCIGPLIHLESRAYDHIKDFLSQKFGVAMLHASNQGDLKTEALLKELFDEIVKNPPK